jgi:hypothetical protein
MNRLVHHDQADRFSGMPDYALTGTVNETRILGRLLV